MGGFVFPVPSARKIEYENGKHPGKVNYPQGTASSKRHIGIPHMNEIQFAPFVPGDQEYSPGDQMDERDMKNIIEQGNLTEYHKHIGCIVIDLFDI